MLETLSFCKMSNLKNELLHAIKRDEWRRNICDEDYKEKMELINDLHKKNLDVVSQENKAFKCKRVIGKKPRVTTAINEETLRAYEEWKGKNCRERDCPEVSVQNLLLLLHYLDSKSGSNSKGETGECLKRQNSEFETFWDSPTYILRLLRKCVYTRDWNNLTYFSLIMLNYDRKYLQIIKNMCKIMVKYNPLIEECGLTEQFQTLFQEPDKQLVV